MRFTNKSDVAEVVVCSAQATAQLTAEVSDYDAQVCDGNIRVPVALQICTDSKVSLAVVSLSRLFFCAILSELSLK